jgi:hypothetical protein
MWRKATHYRLATFAALIVGSSIALITGVQAETVLSLVPTSSNLIFSSTSQQIAGMPGIQRSSATGGSATVSGSASLDNLSGTFTLTLPQGGVAGFDGTNFNFIAGAGTSLTAMLGPGTNTLNTASITLTNILNANTNDPILTGTYSYQRNFSSGVFGTTGAFPTTGTFALPMTGVTPTLASLLPPTTPGTSVTPTVTAGGGLNIPAAPPIPLPPAIYLFGSVLGGAFWLGRRKRSAVSGLAAA